MEALEQALATKKYRITTPRKSIFELLLEAREPLPIHEIIQQLPAVNRVSIYRTLELFDQLNIITIIHVGWKKRYELSNVYQQHHHHHLVCTSCGSITEINSERLEDVIHTLTGAHNFSPTGHTFEITGLCRTCT